jgi:hypothetical protein
MRPGGASRWVCSCAPGRIDCSRFHAPWSHRSGATGRRCDGVRKSIAARTLSSSDSSPNVSQCSAARRACSRRKPSERSHGITPSGSFSSAIDLARASARLCFMNSGPNARSASSWLCARQRRRRFSTVDVPPRATGSMWSSWMCRLEPQRCPESPTNVQRPPSRFHTADTTEAGMCRGFSLAGLRLGQAGLRDFRFSRRATRSRSDRRITSFGSSERNW